MKKGHKAWSYIDTVEEDYTEALDNKTQGSYRLNCSVRERTQEAFVASVHDEVPNEAANQAEMQYIAQDNSLKGTAG
ncbi:hypothetical protein ABBQ32_000987 [Trebouxia sp. C0010 RCD-2024]